MFLIRKKNERLNELLRYQLVIAEKRYASRIGREMEILVEGLARHQNLLESTQASSGSRVWTGHSGCNRVVNFVSDSPRALTGRFVRVKITAATSLSLTGELVHDPLEAERQGEIVGEMSEPISSEVVS